jgi:hypothetical protein
VAEIAKAACKEVATNRDVLRRLLMACLPADLLATLDIEALIDAMIASTVITVEFTDADSGSGSGSKTPPGKASPPGKAAPPGPSVTVTVEQNIPKISAADVGRAARLARPPFTISALGALR